MNDQEIKKALKAVDLIKILQGQQALGNTINTKDLGEHKFWKTQPVIQTIGGGPSPVAAEVEGPIDPPRQIADVRTDPLPLPAGYEWSTVDVSVPAQLAECQTLLSENYVEDPDASFRLGYTVEFLRWALAPPGYVREWHVGWHTDGCEGAPRVSRRSKESATPPPPATANHHLAPPHARSTFKAAEINFLCAHKKLRNKRLAPVLIKEVTRRVNLTGIWQAVYTAGVVIPTPISTCRYYHRNLNPAKLVDIGFTPIGRGETISRLVRKYALPASPLLPGFREMTAADVPAVGKLLRAYMGRYEMQQVFTTDDEVAHWFLSGTGEGEYVKGQGRKGQVVWSYVVEDPATNRITDFMSFYSLPSLIMKHPKHKSLNTAYAFYYATDVIPLPSPATTAAAGENTDSAADKERLGRRLNALVKDCLIVAKHAGFDVFNALSLMDNNLFLHEQMFGPGDGYLVSSPRPRGRSVPPSLTACLPYANRVCRFGGIELYVFVPNYLYNWKCAPINGARDDWKTKETSKIGVVML
ncbi:hypothetical protein QFC19_005152 [Naganishia cerealis]|uniref:Uncharacterized protein n=1 Tax=Naganishia cerealis TaxID=610337 RepID=A0ACC2VPY2_9TREE|nr:hypothetical protein QFC19_005152 [Naganishia cerealis]